MERPVYRPIGTPEDQLDTPTLLVDLAVMERNIETLHAFFRTSPAKARPHVTSHKCPAIAHRQLAAGGTVGGVSVSRVGEAEVFAGAGFSDILVSSEIVTRGKINRLCSLAKSATVAVVVDNPKNVQDLSDAAGAGGATLRVLVHIATGPDAPGVEPGDPAVELAKQVARSPGLKFAGLMTPESAIMREEHQDTLGQLGPVVQSVLDTRAALEKAGLEVETVSVGGVHNYEAAASTKGVTEVTIGGCPLMDFSYCQHLEQFQPAAKILMTVISRPIAERAVGDVGHKTAANDRGLPVVEGLPGAVLNRLSAEHAGLALEGSARGSVKVGDKLRLIPRDLDPCVNQYNFLNAVREGRLEAVWEIAARGRSD